DGVFAGSGAYSGNIGSVDFYSVDGNCRYYIDDIVFTDIVNVTYQVDITNYLAGGAVISPGGMRVGGNFSDLGAALPNWSPSDPACAMTDIGGNIWEITVAYPAGSAGSTQQYKYVNGDWFPAGENEFDDGAPSLFGVLGCGGDNREVTIPESDMTYLFCWETCSACEDLDETVAVTYQVDITNYLADGAVISPAGIRIGGNFSDLGASLPSWTPSDPACAMTNIYGNVWAITVEYPLGSAGLTQQFKFVNGDWYPTGENEYDDTPSLFGDLGCGGDNREQIIPGVPTEYLWCWEQCTACAVECTALAPTGIYVDDITATSGTVHWDAVSGADQYVGALWNLTTGVIRKFRVNDATSYTLPAALTPSTTYGVRLKTACLASDEFSAYSSFYYFTTSPLRIGEFMQGADIYPNPNNGNFNMQLLGYENTEVQIEIMHMAGQKIFVKNMYVMEPVYTLEIQLNQVPPGAYIVRVLY
ncbi:MAG: T9SS type A sorting domain-containing protein, partial [Chitinophagales bacterium]